MNDINIFELSSSLESLLNRKHNEIDHEFVVDGQLFSELFYLVDGIYPHRTWFLGTETDPFTKLDGTFAIEQEAIRKDVECGIGVLKLKFLSLTDPINLHHWDDMNHSALATTLMHKMMVEDWVSDTQVEDG